MLKKMYWHRTQQFTNIDINTTPFFKQEERIWWHDIGLMNGFAIDYKNKDCRFFIDSLKQV